MAPKAKGAKDSIDKFRPRRPHLILRTLPLVFHTPQHTVTLRFTMSNPGLKTLPAVSLTPPPGPQRSPRNSVRSSRSSDDADDATTSSRRTGDSDPITASDSRSERSSVHGWPEEVGLELGTNMRTFVESQIDGVTNRVDKLEKKFDTKFTELEEKFDTKFTELEKKVDTKFADFERRLDEKLDARFKKMQEELLEALRKSIKDSNGGLSAGSTAISRSELESASNTSTAVPAAQMGTASSSAPRHPIAQPIMDLRSKPSSSSPMPSFLLSPVDDDSTSHIDFEPGPSTFPRRIASAPNLGEVPMTETEGIENVRVSENMRVLEDVRVLENVRVLDSLIRQILKARDALLGKKPKEGLN